MADFYVQIYTGGESPWHRLATVDAENHDDAEAKFKALLQDGKFTEEKGRFRTIWTIDGALGIRIEEKGDSKRFRVV